MKIRTLLLISLFLLLTGCSGKYGMNFNLKNGNPQTINIMTGSFVGSGIKLGNGSGNIDTGLILKTEKRKPKQIILQKLLEIGAGMISECEYKSVLYFSVDFNNLKTSTKIIDEQGNIVATCDYQIKSKKKNDPICDGLEKCNLIYVAIDNVRGYNPIDKYLITK